MPKKSIIVLANKADYAPTAGNNLGPRTDQIDLTSLDYPQWRQSDKFDFGDLRSRYWEVTAAIEPHTGNTPTAGETIRFYIGYSRSSVAATDNPAGLSGSDARWYGYDSADADAAEALSQLVSIGTLAMTADVAIQVGHIGVIEPRAQYGILVVNNNLATDGRILKDDAHEMAIRLTPMAWRHT